MTFADRLRELIELSPLSRQEIAERAGLKSQARITQILNGDPANPRIDTVEAILKAIGCKAADLDDAE